VVGKHEGVMALLLMFGRSVGYHDDDYRSRLLTLCLTMPYSVDHNLGGPGGASLTSLRRAYVTLLYKDFLAAVRTLGQSLRNTGTTADMVVLVTPEVSESSRKTLQQDGKGLKL